MADNDYDDETHNAHLLSRLNAVELLGFSEPKDPLSSDVALPWLMLKRVLKGRAYFLSAKAQLCLILKVPSAQWADPVVNVARQLSRWDSIVTATKLPTKNETGDAQIRHLASGGRVMCVATSERFVPPAISASADHTIDLGRPTDADLKRLIKLVTRTPVKEIPAGIAGRLDYSTIVGAVRLGSSAKDCVDRLVTAAKSTVKEDASLRAVPDFSQLHGYGEAKDWGLQLMADLDAWRAGHLPFDAIQRCAVLASPPGLGKTTFARSLAKSAGLKFFPTSVGNWFSQSPGYLDSIIKQIDTLFQSAAASGNALVLLDELDSIPNRATMESRHAEWWTPVIGHLLTTLDSASSTVSANLVILGATNFPEKLDSALIRPGRLSRVIHIGHPDADALAGILRQHLGTSLPDIDLRPIALAGLGATGADAAEWVKVAQARARHAGRQLALEDLAVQVVSSSIIDPDVQYRIAAHEAGHALAAICLDIGELQMVSITSRKEDGGQTNIKLNPFLMTKTERERLAMYLLAGRCAEQAMLGSISSGSGGGADSDLARVTDLLAANHVSFGMGKYLAHRGDPAEARMLLRMNPYLFKDVEEDLQRIIQRSLELIEQNRAMVHQIAAALMEKKVLSGADVMQILAGHPESRRVSHG